MKVLCAAAGGTGRRGALRCACCARCNPGWMMSLRHGICATVGPSVELIYMSPGDEQRSKGDAATQICPKRGAAAQKNSPAARLANHGGENVSPPPRAHFGHPKTRTQACRVASSEGRHRNLRPSRTRARPSLRGWTVGALHQDRCSVGGTNVGNELSGLFITSTSVANRQSGISPG